MGLFLKSDAPFEVACSRIQLARAFAELGRIEQAVEQLHSAIDLSELKAEVALALAHSLLSSLSGSGLAGGFKSALSSVDSGCLSRRELEVLHLVAQGLSNQPIAARLFVSDHTVHRHLANILNKLNVSTRAAAVAHAARRGLLT